MKRNRVEFFSSNALTNETCVSRIILHIDLRMVGNLLPSRIYGFLFFPLCAASINRNEAEV